MEKEEKNEWKESAKDSPFKQFAEKKLNVLV